MAAFISLLCEMIVLVIGIVWFTVFLLGIMIAGITFFVYFIIF